MMKKECPNYCGLEYGKLLDRLKNIEEKEKVILQNRQYLLDAGQDVTRENLELKKIYDNINNIIKWDYPIVVIDKINFDLNTKEKLESAIQPMMNRLEKVYFTKNP